MKCNGCEEKATINLNTQFHRFELVKGNWTNEKVWDEGTNEFWCERCAEKEGLI